MKEWKRNPQIPEWNGCSKMPLIHVKYSRINKKGVFDMPAPKTIFIPHSCFGYYDEKFNECTKKCKISESCKNATNSTEYEDVRKIYKYMNKQIDELVQKFKDKKTR